MSRFIVMTLAVLAACALVPTTSSAAQPHFTACDASTVDGDLTLTGQIAGLGNQLRPPIPLHLAVTATAACLDPTTTPPSLVGAVTITDDALYPPKNGNRKYAFLLDTPFVLPCDPPAEIVFVAVEVCDTTHGICCPPLAAAPEPE